MTENILDMPTAKWDRYNVIEWQRIAHGWIVLAMITDNPARKREAKDLARDALSRSRFFRTNMDEEVLAF